MEKLSRKTLNNICCIGEETLKDKELAIIYNAVGFTNKIDFSQEDSDFFSNKEIGEIFDALFRKNARLFTFPNELEYIQNTLNNDLPSNLLIWNLSRQGGDNNKKSLVTSMADFMNLEYIGSSVYTMNLCRHKFHFQKIIHSSLITKFPSEFDARKYADASITFLIKPEKGSASRGMSSSLTNLSSSTVLELIEKKQLKPQDIIQQYIQGYEIEVPLIQYNGVFLSLGICGIQKNGEIFFKSGILEEEMYDTKYEFYDFEDEIDNPVLCDAIIAEAVRIAKLTELKDYGRVDFRVDFKNNFYCFDIATTPYLTEHSSFNFLMEQQDFSHPDLLSLIIGAHHSNTECL
ncbi:D-alanine--D-alanine ligase family protein [Pseudolactococcus reticulitermitis]|uniref:ATP-grasp domain-containing protein n=1 Tax=Pseudolactococcus reticulitermitis TaxID=2025039 RepID=A0A224X4M6_9LACT|nr:hypothetical protein [Lactococcus reticulitermitis]GAX47626.1 hypothetical protein RsY01_1226 [Lactococcus reticulitermitis]